MIDDECFILEANIFALKDYKLKIDIAFSAYEAIQKI